MPNVDFTALKARLSFEDVIEHLKLPMTLKDGKYRGVCPACQSSTRALVVTPERGAYRFDAKKGGDIIWLASHVQKIGVRQAAEALDQAFPAVIREPEKAPEKPAQNGKEGLLRVADTLLYEHEAVQALGLSPAVAKACGIGWKLRGIHAKSVVLPLYDDGELTGYAALRDGTLVFPKNLCS